MLQSQLYVKENEQNIWGEKCQEKDLLFYTFSTAIILATLRAQLL